MSRLTVGHLLDVAAAEVGYLEKRDGAQLDDKTANAGANNYTKYGRDMHRVQPRNMDYPAAWCDCFVDWCFWKASGKDTAKAKRALCGDFDDYTVFSAQRYKDAGRWTKTAHVGDQIFFKDAGGGICHTGIVEHVADGFVHTIEGNTSGASGVVANGGGVCRKVYGADFKRIAGYGRPRYEKLVGYKTLVTRYLYPEPKKQPKRRLCKVPRGATVEYVGGKSGNWRKVRYGKTVGWMGIKAAGVSTAKGVYEQ